MSARNAVVLITDATILPACAFLATRLAELNPRSDTDIILLSDTRHGLDEARAVGVPAILRHTTFDALSVGWTRQSAWPKAAYHHIVVPAQLKEEYRRIVYIDVDTYPVSLGLFDVFDLQLAGNAVAGVRAIITAFSAHFRDFRQSANLTFGCRWLNTGILIVDPERYVALDIEGRARAMMQAATTPPINADEGVLNAVLGDDWLELSPRFQSHFLLSHSDVTQVFPPELVHFAGPCKPWSTPTPAHSHPARAELAAYLAGTPWHGFFDRWRRRSRRWPPFLSSLLRQYSTRRRHDRLAELFFSGAFGTGLVVPALHRYLRDTEFADVTQGITQPRLSFAQVERD